jgi:hypothetical protein
VPSVVQRSDSQRPDSRYISCRELANCMEKRIRLSLSTGRIQDFPRFKATLSCLSTRDRGDPYGILLLKK